MRSVLTLDERAIASEEQRLARSGFAALGEAVLDVARAETPVLTGKLRSSLYVQVYHQGALVHGGGPRPDGIRGQGIEVFIGSDSGYGRWVHDGTSDTPSHPFMATAMAMIGPRAASIIGAAF